MNYLWGGMILIGIIYGMCTGNMSQVTEAILDGGKEAVGLCISMAGIVAMWSGVMRIAQEAGLIQRMTQKMNPILSFLFPKLPKQHEARDYISTNMIANILGLGWAATPAGLKAMECLAELEEERRTKHVCKAMQMATVASNEMCNFLIINISSLQLIPVTIIAYRSQYGSVNPAGIVGPAILATSISTLIAVIFCSVKNYISQRTKEHA